MQRCRDSCIPEYYNDINKTNKEVTIEVIGLMFKDNDYSNYKRYIRNVSLVKKFSTTCTID